ncbi:calcium-binding protein [Endozoicomonas euniceicola]|uniref:Ca2+-binding RTX toxin-like protein n=1 Tax=Endozoicomonas euniceicola TaxID=1234143 RepID=A0ABY6GY67_9GAMM|nr:hypothetical protein [Endozoicomonas euniceicola]UYM17725.1 hypothetical protein NX720_07400 [Endozoicomonas euniceicola]
MSTLKLDSEFQASFQKYFNQALAEGVSDSFKGNHESLDPGIAINAMVNALKESGADADTIESIQNLKDNEEIKDYNKNFSDLLNSKEVDAFNRSELNVNENLNDLLDFSANVHNYSDFDLFKEGATKYGGKVGSSVVSGVLTGIDINDFLDMKAREQKLDSALNYYHNKLDPDLTTESFEKVFKEYNPGELTPKEKALSNIYDALDDQDTFAADEAAKAKTTYGKIKSKVGTIGSAGATLVGIGLDGKGIADNVNKIDDLETALKNKEITQEEFDFQKRQAIIKTTINSIGLASGVVTGSEKIAQQITKYSVQHGTKGVAVTGSKQVTKLAPVVGDMLAIAMSTASLVQNAMSADYAREQGNHGRAAMFGVMATLDSVNVVLNGVGLALEFIPGVGNLASMAVNLVTIGVDFVKSLIGVFTDMVDTREEHEKIAEQFEKYVNSSAFQNEVSNLSEGYKEKGYDIFEYRIDSSSAGIEGSESAHSKVPLHSELRNLSGKVLEGIDKTDLKNVIYDNTGKTETIDLGKGDDLIKLFNDKGVKTIYGGDGNDQLISLNGDHELNGDKGDDNIFRRNGHGDANGGEGDDNLEYLLSTGVITGGPGNDRIKTDKGHVVLKGDQGDDTLLGGFGINPIDGGDGDDIMDGGLSFDRVFGGKGNDYIVTGLGYDIVHGDINKDYSGGLDPNSIDTLSFRNTGVATELYKNELTRDRLLEIGYNINLNDDDHSFARSEKKKYAVTKFSDLFDNDFVQKTKAIESTAVSRAFTIDYDLFNSYTEDTIKVYEGKEEIEKFFNEKLNALNILRQPQGLYLLGEGLYEMKSAPGYDKTLILTNGDNLVVIGEQRAFEITKDDFDDFTKHDETSTYRPLTQDFWKYLAGQFGGLTQFSEIEKVIDSHGSDSISGSDGSDTIVFGRGEKDIVNARGGDDVLIFDHGIDGNFFQEESNRDNDTTYKLLTGEYHVNGGSGQDTLLIRPSPYFNHTTYYTGSNPNASYSPSFWEFPAPGETRKVNLPYTFDLRLGEATTKIFGKALYVKNVETIIGQDKSYIASSSNYQYSNDHIVADDIDNKIYGKSGDDRLEGRGGDDLLHGGEGRDSLYGGAGNDTLISGGNDDQLYGETGNDHLVATDGLVTMHGGEGKDTYQIQVVSKDPARPWSVARAKITENDEGNVLVFDGISDLDSMTLTGHKNGLIMKDEQGHSVLEWNTSKAFTDYRELAESFSETFVGIVFSETNKGMTEDQIKKLLLDKFKSAITRTDENYKGKADLSVDMVLSDSLAQEGSDYDDSIVVDRYSEGKAINAHGGDDLIIATYAEDDGSSTKTSTVNTGTGSDMVVIGNTDRKVDINFLSSGKLSTDVNTLLIKNLDMNKIQHAQKGSRHELSYDGKVFATLDALPDRLLIEDAHYDHTWVIDDIPNYFGATDARKAPTAFLDKNMNVGIAFSELALDVNTVDHHRIEAAVTGDSITFYSTMDNYVAGDGSSYTQTRHEMRSISQTKLAEMGVAQFITEWVTEMPGGIRFGNSYMSITEFSKDILLSLRKSNDSYETSLDLSEAYKALATIASVDRNYTQPEGKPVDYVDMPEYVVDLADGSDVNLFVTSHDHSLVDADKEDMTKIIRADFSQLDNALLVIGGGPTGAGVTADDLWFAKSGTDLLVDVIGTDDEITIKDWFQDDAKKPDYIGAGHRQLNADKVSSLVNAMAAFDAPPAGDAKLDSAVRDQITPVIAAAWSTSVLS